MAGPSTVLLSITAVILLLTTIFIRLLYILPSTNPTRPPPRKRNTPTRVLIVLGSGGHTAEMFALLHNLNLISYGHRSYVVSAGDDFSAGKARDYEASIDGENYDIMIVPRARKIHQPLWTTPVSALECLLACFRILYSCPDSKGPRYPDLILMNGPGTAVCVALAALAIRFFGLPGSLGMMRTIYVESFARVKNLSLSGRLLVPVVDRFIVQWEALKQYGRRVEYLGVLVA
ncbi:MAG: UDP-N-acetylglucosamine transferase subunit [Cirrosporium novae-zelandiae]|nr:MAG: UDP-N-acetylglucosamine transferase subunit [Cirrosporium novae-zelandiae]